MFESTTERRGFPGGLRAQLLIGLVVLVVGTMALVALIGMHLARQQVRQSQLERTAEAAERLAHLREFVATDEWLEAGAPGGEEYVRVRVGDREMVKAVGEAADAPDKWEGEAADALDNWGSEAADAPDNWGSEGGGPAESRGSEGGGPADSRGSEGGGPADSRGGEGVSVRTTSIDGAPYAVATTVAGEGGERAEILVARSLDEAYERLARSRRLLLAYLGLDAVFILIVGYAFFTFVVVRPIRAIGVATERAARGDLASHVDILPPNEFGRVGRSFNRMLDELRDNRRKLEARVEELDAANRELEQTQESLIRSEKMASVGQLAAGVAHEIGNPLSAISGYLEIVDDPELDAERRAEIVGRMSGQVERIQAIIRDLLDYSRDESNRTIEPTAVAPCVAEAVDLVSPQPSAREVEVAVDLPDDLPKVRANRDELVQVLVNLLMNAAEAVDEGRIEVAARVDEEGVQVRVADDGPGISDEERQRIFDPFYTTKDPGEGTGLGLAIALRIMDRFDADLGVESEPGDGAEFVLSFEVSE